MQQRVAIAVAEEALVVRDGDAAENQRAAIDQAVDVVAVAYADGNTSGMTRDARMDSARARSCGVVTFRLP